MSSDWEYKDFTLTWPQGTTGWVSADYTAPAAKLHYWQEYQSSIMPDLQRLLDDGWQPTGEIGPACMTPLKLLGFQNSSVILPHFGSSFAVSMINRRLFDVLFRNLAPLLLRENGAPTFLQWSHVLNFDSSSLMTLETYSGGGQQQLLFSGRSVWGFSCFPLYGRVVGNFKWWAFK